MSLCANIEAITEFTRNYLKTRGAHAFSEYTLIRDLQATEQFNNLSSDNSSLLLFQKHFLCMHVLYRLQDFYRQRNMHLNINPLAIYLTAEHSASETSAPTLHENELRSYYLDLSILEQATSESVSELQQHFFKRYEAWLASDQAYKVLDIANTSSWQQIQEQYRRLAHKNHPDRGGDGDQFNRIKEAYDQLKLRHSPTN